jgi:beta-galactosidase
MGLFLILALAQACAAFGLSHVAGQGRHRQLFDDNWRFKAGEVVDGQKPDLAAADWEKVNLPHDYMIEGKGTAHGDKPEMHGSFNRNSPGGGGNGYLDGGVGWYRKTFSMCPSQKDKRVFVEFEGVYMDSEAWINGQSLGGRPYGYSSFEYELTPYLKYGKEPNVLVVRVNAQQPSSRWYSGAGIYRHVWLNCVEPMHVTHWGVQATTPEVTDARAVVNVKTTVFNQSDRESPVEVKTVILDATGAVVVTASSTLATLAPGVYGTLASNAHGIQEVQLNVPKPRLWSIEDPYLYTIRSLVKVGNKTVDKVETPLGIRTFKFDADKGFFLNGKHVALQGVCLHHDQGPLGAAAFDRAIERQLEILKSMGCNAIRTSHNPPAPALLDLCDRMGFVVMDEAFDEWLQPKRKMGYGRFFDEWSERDIKDMVLRDRNHPSVVMWSIGNEIPEQRKANGREMATRLTEFVRQVDSTRPVTSNMDHADIALETGFAAPLDLIGISYHAQFYQKFKGQRALLGSETSSTVSSRGDYNLELKDGKVVIAVEKDHQVTAYDKFVPRWATNVEASFKALKAAPWVAGEFVWTGFDYIGEPTPFGWPSRSSYFGIVDLCGFPKDRYYLYKSQWTSAPMVHVMPKWNWPDAFIGKAIPVWCYTNADSVELFLNGKSLGKRDWAGTQDLHLAWDVPYEPGTLKAVASDRSGKVVAVDAVQTAGSPMRVALSVDRPSIRADGQDLAYVTARVLDAEGRACPDADIPLTATLRGPGKLAGMANGDATDLESFQGPTVMADHGLALAVIRAGKTPGKIVVQVAGGGLPAAEVAIEAKCAAR